MSVFTVNQKTSIQAGAKKRARLGRVTQKAVTRNKDNRNVYIYSPAGLGKTHSVNSAISKTNVQVVTISGNVGMFAFGLNLAVLAHSKAKDEKIIINVDDCDALFKDELNINIMKNMLDIANPKRSYNYTKKLIVELTDVQQDAINYFSDARKIGFEVPVSDFLFIITSNSRLPTEDDVANSKRSVMTAHKYAIRSRCYTNDFDLTSAEQWGWVADVVMNTDALNKIKKKYKVELLQWMFDNWDNLTERSIRTAEKMAAMMIEDAEYYMEDWEIDFIK